MGFGIDDVASKLGITQSQAKALDELDGKADGQVENCIFEKAKFYQDKAKENPNYYEEAMRDVNTPENHGVIRILANLLGKAEKNEEVADNKADDSVTPDVLPAENRNQLKESVVEWEYSSWREGDARGNEMTKTTYENGVPIETVVYSDSNLTDKGFVGEPDGHVDNIRTTKRDNQGRIIEKANDWNADLIDDYVVRTEYNNNGYVVTASYKEGIDSIEEVQTDANGEPKITTFKDGNGNVKSIKMHGFGLE